MPSARATGITRRQFNAGILSAAAAGLAAPAILRGQNLNSKLDIAMVACGGRGGANLQAVEGENIIALCDVNGRNVEQAGGKFPKAQRFNDFRKLFDKVTDSIDAVVVSTCEHTHAMAVMMALRAGKHVYCEKPLTHDIYEARQVRELAAKTKVVTQMGIQIHGSENYRRVVEIIRSGAIGPVRKAHVWVSRAWGLQPKESAEKYKDIVYVTDRPKEAQTPPDYLNWDAWLGPAPERPFNEVYFPGPKWYRWWDFGNGTMSDLGSHWNDLAFWALNLKAPLTVEAMNASAPVHPEIAPASMTAVYEYGPRGEGDQAMPAVTVFWHQGENKPDIWRAGRIPKWGDGHLFIGDKGVLLSNYEKYTLLPEKDFKGYKPPPRTIPRVSEHHAEWIECCKTGRQASANFEYSGWLTEANHLGNVAFRVGKKLEWDAEKMKATNAPEADTLIRRPYRKGWELNP